MKVHLIEGSRQCNMVLAGLRHLATTMRRSELTGLLHNLLNDGSYDQPVITADEVDALGDLMQGQPTDTN